MFLLYGANGYTGELIIQEALRKGLSPILAGRNEAKIQALGTKYNLPFAVFDLSETAKLEAVLADVPLVLHCAGPFMYTAKPMMEACIRLNKHYLDITGEISVFETAAAMGERAAAAGSMLMPGVGFDVVPTDCMAVYLKNLLPTATDLRLAFAGLGAGLSHGTATTMVENLHEGGAIRKNGKLEKVNAAYKSGMIPFPTKPLMAMTIPWGDLATAWRSTGIPNIETWMAAHPKQVSFSKKSNYLKWFFKLRFVKDYLIKQIKKKPAGPNAEKRAASSMEIWGEATDHNTGKTVSGSLQTPEGYNLTALCAVLIVQKVLNGQFQAGFRTPAQQYGADLIMEIPGVVRK